MWGSFAEAGGVPPDVLRRAAFETIVLGLRNRSFAVQLIMRAIVESGNAFGDANRRMELGLAEPARRGLRGRAALKRGVDEPLERALPLLDATR